MGDSLSVKSQRMHWGSACAEAAGSTPMSWLKGVKGSPDSNDTSMYARS